MSAANNIVALFPDRPPIIHDCSTLDEIKRVAESNKRDYIREVAEDIHQEVFRRLALAGIPIEDERIMKDQFMVYEAIKSLMCRSFGLSHSLQRLTDKYVSIPDDVMEAVSDERG